MKNLPFVLWLMGFPITISICQAIDYVFRDRQPEITPLSALIILGFYIFIAYKLKE